MFKEMTLVYARYIQKTNKLNNKLNAGEFGGYKWHSSSDTMVNAMAFCLRALLKWPFVTVGIDR